MFLFFAFSVVPVSVQAALLADGRLHLQHGPIDCLCRAWGEPDEVRAAYAQAAEIFPGILPELCAELEVLRAPLPGPWAMGAVGRAMQEACAPYAVGFITPMAAVAGAVADAVLAAMLAGRRLERAFVNNGGDIAVHLAEGQMLRCGVVGELAAPAVDGVPELDGMIMLRRSGGVATSGRACKGPIGEGRGGRSFSFGIADAVTVLAADAARADAAATVIGNAVDLPGQPGGHGTVVRRRASEIDPDSDLGGRLVTWEVGPLTSEEVGAALDAGRRVADALARAGLIAGAVLMLRRCVVVSGTAGMEMLTA